MNHHETSPYPTKGRTRSRLNRTKGFLTRHSYGLAGSTFGGFAIEQGVTGNTLNAVSGSAIALSFLSVEGVSLLTQKADRLREAETGTLSTKGFTISPNPTAEALAFYTEIPFVDVPEKIVYTPKNRLAFLKKDPIQTLRYNKSLKKNAAAIYDKGYNALFTRENVGIVIDLHENAHGLINQINPEIAHFQTNFMKSFRNEIPPVNIERATAYACFDEGMAQWLSLFAAERLYYDLKHKDRPADHVLDAMRGEIPDWLVNRIRTNSDDVNSLVVNGFNEPDEDDVQKIQTVIGIYENAFSIRGNSALTNVRKYTLHRRAEDLLDTVEYDVGSYFSNECIMTLVNSGMSIRDSIITLIQNPPETVDELTHPDRFVREKILTQPGE